MRCTRAESCAKQDKARGPRAGKTRHAAREPARLWVTWPHKQVNLDSSCVQGWIGLACEGALSMGITTAVVRQIRQGGPCQASHQERAHHPIQHQGCCQLKPDAALPEHLKHDLVADLQYPKAHFIDHQASPAVHILPKGLHALSAAEALLEQCGYEL